MYLSIFSKIQKAYYLLLGKYVLKVKLSAYSVVSKAFKYNVGLKQ